MDAQKAMLRVNRQCAVLPPPCCYRTVRVMAMPRLFARRRGGPGLRCTWMCECRECMDAQERPRDAANPGYKKAIKNGRPKAPVGVLHVT